MGEIGPFDIVQAAVPSPSPLHVGLGGRTRELGPFVGYRGTTPVVIRDPLIMQYSGPNFRERTGEEWPLEELDLLSSGMTGPKDRDITA